MKKLGSIFVVAAIIFVGRPTFAIMGPALDSEDVPDSICKVDVFSHGKSVEQCSGVLSDQDTVTTAAHCLTDVYAKKLHVEVSCGSQPVKSDVDHFNVDIRYLTSKGEDERLRFDIGQVVFKSPVPSNKIKRMRVASIGEIQDRYFYELIYQKPEIQCAAGGFGISGDEIGVLHTLKLSGLSMEVNSQPFQFEKLNNFPFEPAQGEQFEKEMRVITNEHLSTDAAAIKKTKVISRVPGFEGFLLGDSGGPLFCRADSGPWVLIGVASRVKLSWSKSGLEITDIWSTIDLSQLLLFHPTVTAPKSEGKFQPHVLIR